MAIVLDSTATSTDQTAGPITWNHTVGGGASSLLVVTLALVATGTQPTVIGQTGTYGGIALTQIQASSSSGVTDVTQVSIWCLFNPPVGTNQISINFTGGTSPHGRGASVSYFGAQQSNVPDNFAGNGGSGTGNTATSLTTIANQCWAVSVCVNSATTSPTATAQLMQRATGTLGNTQPAVMTLQDSNGVINPPGSTNVGFTIGGTGENAWAVTSASFAPGQYSGQDFQNSQPFVRVGGGMSRSERAS